MGAGRQAYLQTRLPELTMPVLLLAVATVLLYWPTVVTDVAGLVVVALVWFMQKTKNKRDAMVAVTA
jgi:TRAP-type uncharacterized transport system fused permease subunit